MDMVEDNHRAAIKQKDEELENLRNQLVEA